MAAVLARKATGDAKVVRKLADDLGIDDEAVGFHAQQAVEKWLKAVIASRGTDFEHTHDLRHLIALAGLDSGAAPFDIAEAVALTEYAIPLRYEDLLDAEALDREAVVALVEQVGKWATAELESDPDPAERARIEVAVTALVAEHGYGQLALPALLERAGVGEDAFRCDFVDLEDCFCAAVQAGTEELLARAATALAAQEGWRDQIRAVAYAMLDFLVEDSARAHLMVVESATACERSRQIREGGMAALAALIDLGRGELDDPNAVPAGTAELTAGAVYNRIHTAIESGDPLSEEMVRELMYSVVKPYLGAEAALAELQMPRPAA